MIVIRIQKYYTFERMAILFHLIPRCLYYILKKTGAERGPIPLDTDCTWMRTSDTRELSSSLNFVLTFTTTAPLTHSALTWLDKPAHVIMTSSSPTSFSQPLPTCFFKASSWTPECATVTTAPFCLAMWVRGDPTMGLLPITSTRLSSTSTLNSSINNIAAAGVTGGTHLCFRFSTGQRSEYHLHPLRHQWQNTPLQYQCDQGEATSTVYHQHSSLHWSQWVTHLLYWKHQDWFLQHQIRCFSSSYLGKPASRSIAVNL